MEEQNEDEYQVNVDENANLVLKKTSEVKKGKKSKASGSQFELRVRKDLEEKGWIVSKWPNNLEDNKIIPSKRVFQRFNRNMGIMTIGTGFPDFIAFQRIDNLYKIIGVEVKSNGILQKTEKEKCAWYLKNKTFSEVWVAQKIKDGRKVVVEYKNFTEFYPKFLI